MRRPIIGQIGRALGGIPVERPQDLAKPGRGSIIKIENDKMFGLQTQFTTQCKENDIILISGVLPKSNCSSKSSSTSRRS